MKEILIYIYLLVTIIIVGAAVTILMDNKPLEMDSSEFIDYHINSRFDMARYATTKELAAVQLTVITNFLEANNLTTGNTSAVDEFKVTNDLGFWYKNIKLYRDELLQSKCDSKIFRADKSSTISTLYYSQPRGIYNYMFPHEKDVRLMRFWSWVAIIIILIFWIITLLHKSGFDSNDTFIG